MFYVPKFPCYKIYKKSNHAMQIVWFENKTSMNHFEQSCVGNFLIQFLEMDISPFQKAMNGFIKGDGFNFDLLFELGYRGVCDKMRDAADLLSDNLHLHRFLVAALERCFVKKEWSDPEQLKNAFMVLGNILILREDFQHGLPFCLDDSLHPEISLARKFTGFLHSDPKYRDYTFQTGYAMVSADKKGNLDYETVRSVNDNGLDVDAQLATMYNEKGGVSMVPFTWILSFDDLLFYDFVELMSQGLRVKRCKLCNRYFVLKSKHNAEYCDRKAENGRTCKQVGPKILFKAALDKPENAALKEYNRIRQLKQQQLDRDRNKEIGKDVGKAQAEYDAWSEPVKKLRDRFVAGEISKEEFLAEIRKWQPVPSLDV